MILIGEKLNGSIPSAAEMIAERNGEQIQNLARRQAEAGADFIDICAPMERGEAETLRWMAAQVQDVTDVPISIDSPDTEVLQEVFPCCRRPGLFNSISMETKKQIDKVFRIMAENPGWQAVVMLCDDRGTAYAREVEHRLEIFEEVMARAGAYGIAPSRLHIDPMVEAAALFSAECKDQPGERESGTAGTLQVIRSIRKLCPSVHITSALSNISHGLPARKYMNYSFAVLALEAGLDSGIADPLDGGLQAVICGTETLLGMREEEFCMGYIQAYRKGRFGAP